MNLDLTPTRERIIRLSMLDENDKAIAMQLKMTKAGLDYHWRLLKRRYGVRSRLAVGAAYWQETTQSRSPEK